MTPATSTIFAPPSAPSSSSSSSSSSLAPPQTSYYDAAVLHYYLSLAAWYSRPHPDQRQLQSPQPYPHLLPAISMSSATTSTFIASSSADLAPSSARFPPIEPSPSSPSSSSACVAAQPPPGFVFRDETDKLALAAERRRRRSRTTPLTATRDRDRQPQRPDRPQSRHSPPSDLGRQEKSESDKKSEKNEEPSTTAGGGEGNERQATWRDRQGCFTFHTLESLEASKKKGGRVRLKWRKDP